MGYLAQQPMAFRPPVPDNWNFNSSNPCLHVGGNWNQNQNYGLFYVNYNGASNANANVGCRLIAKTAQLTEKSSHIT